MSHLVNEMEFEADDWFEISDDYWLAPRSKGKQLRLLVDAQVPEEVIKEIRAARIRATVVPQSARRSSDSEILGYAHHKGLVVLTLDGDFWDDRKHPLHMIQCGVIYVAEPPDQPKRILRAFGLCYGCFAKTFPLDSWHQMKIKAKVGQFEIKMCSWDGKMARYKMRLAGGRLFAREVEAR